MARARLMKCCEASGYQVQRWEQPLSDLAARADAQTVVIFAEPILSTAEDVKAVREIVERGGRVLLTGWSGGRLAPEGDAEAALAVPVGLQADAAGARRAGRLRRSLDGSRRRLGIGPPARPRAIQLHRRARCGGVQARAKAMWFGGPARLRSKTDRFNAGTT